VVVTLVLLVLTTVNTIRYVKCTQYSTTICMLQCTVYINQNDIARSTADLQMFLTHECIGTNKIHSLQFVCIESVTYYMCILTLQILVHASYRRC
jgi:hypothetical protein